MIDDLPLDAVVEFLHRAAGTGLVERRPPLAADDGVLHLLLAASLEPAIPALEDNRDVAHLARFLSPVCGRASKLQCDMKLDVHAGAQRAVRDILTTAEVAHSALLDLEVVAVKPGWLCSTFAFQPLLGFRQSRRAAIIARGCGTTLLARAERRGKGGGALWTAAWGITHGALPHALPEEGVPPEPVVAGQAGHGWVRPAEVCLPSEEALGRDVAPPATRSQVEGIFRQSAGGDVPL